MKKNNKISEAAAGRIAKIILAVQAKFARIMGKVSSRWKAKQQLIFMYLICLVLGGLSVIAIIKPFNNKDVLHRPAEIHLPKLIPRDADKVIITDNEIEKVRGFKQRLDSLSKTKEGKIKLQRFLKARPGFMDSIEKVDQMYYSQKK